MSLPYELLLFGVAFFGFMAVVSVVQARRKKVIVYYLGATVGVLALLAFVFAFLDKLMLAFLIMITTGLLSIAGLPRMLKVQERELAQQLQSADLAAPLRLREYFTTQWWLRLASTWGVWKTMCLFYLLSVMIIGGTLFALNMVYDFIPVGYVVSYTIGCPILFTFIFYRQFRKVLEKERLT